METMTETMTEKARRTAAELLARAGWDQEPDYAAAFALLGQDTFCGSEPSQERYMLDGANPIDLALDAHAETAAPFHEAVKEYNRLADLCRDEDGLIPVRRDRTGRLRTNPILDHHEEGMREAEGRYWHTRDVLAELLAVEVMASIREALRLAGVTDAPTVDEVTRCVVRGGGMFDGRNIAHAERWRAERAEMARRKAEGEKKPESRLVDITDLLTGAASRRLYDLLAARLPEWGITVDAALAGMETPRLRDGLLLILAGGRAVKRVHGLPWERFHDVLMGTGDPAGMRADAARIVRAMRLLKTLLRAGCLKRGEA